MSIEDSQIPKAIDLLPQDWGLGGTEPYWVDTYIDIQNF